MAWSTPLTAVANAALTAAQWNASVRDNLLLTAPALATGASGLWVSTGANAGAFRTPGLAHVTATQTTTSISSYGDLATVGPTVTLTTGPNAITFQGAAASNSTGGGSAIMSYAVSGATTFAADNARAYRVESGTANQQLRSTTTHYLPSLTPGSNTFTAKYTTGSGGTASFGERHLAVFPL